MRIKLFLFTLILFTTHNTFAQFSVEPFRSIKSIDTNNVDQLFLQIDNSNFLKNNEYFGKFGIGSTSFGYLFFPKLVFYPTSKTKMEAGLFLKQYFGRDGFNKISPWLRFQYQIHPSINLVFGNIYGGLNHELAEPLYQFDRHLKDNPETGIQLLIDKKYFEADIWMNWEKFILPGDTFKEQISSGLTSSIHLFRSKVGFNLSIPYQYTMFHTGGQIDASEEPLMTLINNLSGIKASQKFGSGIVKSIGINQYILSYKDASHKPIGFYDKGHAFYSQIEVKSNLLDVMVGYWNADKFISPKGEHLFQSISYVWDVQEEKREMLTAKVVLHHQIAKDIALNLRFNSYYDLLNLPHEHIKSRFEFAYGIHIIFNRDFFLHMIKNK